MTVTLALDLLLALIARSGEISAVITKARAEGRDTLNSEEWAQILSADDAARSALVASIVKAQSEGR